MPVSGHQPTVASIIYAVGPKQRQDDKVASIHPRSATHHPGSRLRKRGWVTREPSQPSWRIYRHQLKGSACCTHQLDAPTCCTAHHGLTSAHAIYLSTLNCFGSPNTARIPVTTGTTPGRAVAAIPSPWNGSYDTARRFML